LEARCELGASWRTIPAATWLFGPNATTRGTKKKEEKESEKVGQGFWGENKETSHEILVSFDQFPLLLPQALKFLFQRRDCALFIRLI